MEYVKSSEMDGSWETIDGDAQLQNSGAGEPY